MALLLTGIVPPAAVERVLTVLPHHATFGRDAYIGERVSLVQGATRTWPPHAGRRGGPARFTPRLTDREMAGQGRLHLPGLAGIPAQLTLRFLIRHAPAWHLSATGDTLVVMRLSGNPGRPMIVPRFRDARAPRHLRRLRGSVCCGAGGDVRPDGSDRRRIGDPPLARAAEWIGIEAGAHTATRLIRRHVDTAAGALSGLCAERPMDHAGADAVWSYIDTVGGDMGPTMQADPDNCPLIDEAAIDARNIVPPGGVVACCFGDGCEDGDRARQPRPGLQRPARGPPVRHVLAHGAAMGRRIVEPLSSRRRRFASNPSAAHAPRRCRQDDRRACCRDPGRVGCLAPSRRRWVAPGLIRRKRNGSIPCGVGVAEMQESNPAPRRRDPRRSCALHCGGERATRIAAGVDDDAKIAILSAPSAARGTGRGLRQRWSDPGPRPAAQDRMARGAAAHVSRHR